jgi:SOS-response transcriptional repressor LexA
MTLGQEKAKGRMKLSRVQLKILALIQWNRQHNLPSPSWKEMMANLDFASPNALSEQIAKLKNWGLIEHTKGKSRALKLNCTIFAYPNPGEPDEDRDAVPARRHP